MADWQHQSRLKTAIFSFHSFRGRSGQKIAIAVAASLLLGGAAFGADVAPQIYTKAPAVTAVQNWAGFYIGINGGGGSAHKCWDLTNDGGVPVNPPTPEGCHHATGGTAGGQIGYRWQARSWVFGLEAQGNWARFKGSNVDQIPVFGAFGLSNQSKIDAFGLLTAQLGYAVNQVLVYVKGGGAVFKDKYNSISSGVVFPPGALSEGTETRWSPVAGAGIEFAFAPNWSLAAQYDHVFSGTRSVTFYLLPIIGNGLSAIRNIRQDVDIATLRLNYRFGGHAVTRY